MGPRRRLTLLLGGALLLAGIAAPLAEPPAHAATTAAASAGSIFGPCTALDDGEYRYFGRNLYQCVYVWGLGYYWVGVTVEGCRAPARKTTAC